MRKYIVCLSLFLICCIGKIYGQNVSKTLTDYTGTWIGNDASGNAYKLTLNANYSVQLTINGKNSMATLYKLELENSVNSLGYGVIDFYAPTQNSGTNTLTLVATDQPWQMLNCGIISFDGTKMSLQVDKGINRPTQFDVAQTVTLIK
jgi:hypothetical protein